MVIFCLKDGHGHILELGVSFLIQPDLGVEKLGRETVRHELTVFRQVCSECRRWGNFDRINCQRL